MSLHDLLSRSRIVEVAEAASACDQRQAILLDVRDANQWKAGHVAGARHIPLHLVGRAAREGRLPRNTTIICLSDDGTSHETSRLLRRFGMNAVDLKGGIQAWRAANLPEIPG